MENETLNEKVILEDKELLEDKDAVEKEGPPHDEAADFMGAMRELIAKVADKGFSPTRT